LKAISEFNLKAVAEKPEFMRAQLSMKIELIGGANEARNSLAVLFILSKSFYE
jgi:hypothetical protein